MTKYMTEELLMTHMQRVPATFEAGRAATAPTLASFVFSEDQENTQAIIKDEIFFHQTDVIQDDQQGRDAAWNLSSVDVSGNECCFNLAEHMHEADHCDEDIISGGDSKVMKLQESSGGLDTEARSARRVKEETLGFGDGAKGLRARKFARINGRVQLVMLRVEMEKQLVAMPRLEQMEMSDRGWTTAKR